MQDVRVQRQSRHVQHPARHGIMGNSIYIPAVEAKRAFSNDDAKMLLRIEDRIVTSASLAELLHAAG